MSSFARNRNNSTLPIKRARKFLLSSISIDYRPNIGLQRPDLTESPKTRIFQEHCAENVDALGVAWEMHLQEMLFLPNYPNKSTWNYNNFKLYPSSTKPKTNSYFSKPKTISKSFIYHHNKPKVRIQAHI